jgi:hypothetical protein
MNTLELRTSRGLIPRALGALTALLVSSSLPAVADTWGEPNQHPTTRFVFLASFSNWAVLDTETRLVWEYEPSRVSVSWAGSSFDCNNLDLQNFDLVGHRKGWRLPTVQELASLVDTSQLFGLPDGAPFYGVEPTFYWSATTDATAPNKAWGVAFITFSANYIFSVDKTTDRKRWCVRGGQGPDRH